MGRGHVGKKCGVIHTSKKKLRVQRVSAVQRIRLLERG